MISHLQLTRLGQAKSAKDYVVGILGPKIFNNIIAAAAAYVRGKLALCFQYESRRKYVKKVIKTSAVCLLSSYVRHHRAN